MLATLIIWYRKEIWNVLAQENQVESFPFKIDRVWILDGKKMYKSFDRFHKYYCVFPPTFIAKVSVRYFNLFHCFHNLLIITWNMSFPAGNNMFKVNKRNIRARCEICSKVTIKMFKGYNIFHTSFLYCYC